MARPTSEDPGWDPALTPARPARRDQPWPPEPPPTEQRERPAPRETPRDTPREPSRGAAADVDVRDLDRGRTVAMTAALGRLQLAIDLMARNQQAAIEEQRAAIRRLEQQVGDLNVALRSRAAD